MAVNKSKADRARQFAPFAALTGYYDLINETDKVSEPRKILSDEENEELSRKMNMVKKGSMVEISFYDDNFSKKIDGIVTSIDLINRSITIVKRKIHFDDIFGINFIDL